MPKSLQHKVTRGKLGLKCLSGGTEPVLYKFISHNLGFILGKKNIFNGFEN